MSSTKEKIEYGNKIIEFELQLEDRESLVIKVMPNSSIRIKAPLQNSDDEIIEKIKSKAKWIDKQQRYFQENYKTSLEKKYVSGETHLYLGKQYRLKVSEGDSNTVKLKNGYFFVESKNANRINIKKILDNWYKKQARRIFQEQLEACFQRFSKFNIQIPEIKIRNFEKRWGGYSNKNNDIVLNINCIKVPKYCLNYILIHELCHSVHFSHNKKFFELLSAILPDWQKTKTKLEQFEI
jgi:predicted metal-dependent hydrolase